MTLRNLSPIWIPIRTISKKADSDTSKTPRYIPQADENIKTVVDVEGRSVEDVKEAFKAKIASGELRSDFSYAKKAEVRNARNDYLFSKFKEAFDDCPSTITWEEVQELRSSNKAVRTILDREEMTYNLQFNKPKFLEEFDVSKRDMESIMADKSALSAVRRKQSDEIRKAKAVYDAAVAKVEREVDQCLNKISESSLSRIACLDQDDLPIGYHLRFARSDLAWSLMTEEQRDKTENAHLNPNFIRDDAIIEFQKYLYIHWRRGGEQPTALIKKLKNDFGAAGRTLVADVA